MSVMVTGRLPGSGESVALEMAEGKIVAIRPGPQDERLWLSAGLIDLQVNGYGGWDLNADDLSVDSVSELCRALLREGVTTFLPTIITSSEEKIIRALRTLVVARAEDVTARRMIPCVHLEGPSISDQEGPRGAHPAEHVRPPDLAELERWQQASGNLVGMITLSPHFHGSTDYIREVTKRGVRVAIGHTHATSLQIVAAAEAGATLSTHLGNGAHGMLPRHPNYLWSQLAEDRLTATFIADGHHLPDETLLTMLRAKGTERSILVSDTAALGGMAAGEYETPIGGRVTLSADGRLGLSGTPYLAGAALPLWRGVAHCASLPGLSLAQALTMATVNPGAFVGGRGRLAVGEAADVIRFRWATETAQLRLEETWLRGVLQ
ncbi:MAG: N-acetylglucosamine-6-phosphate deacetylase [Scandinavium sp.]|uniref:N-acetylglucosamine-6-phosphate deacetylase n=1 Tax=Scandinavium sp. TaxID=2830653 RepID=UPI003F322AFA